MNQAKARGHQFRINARQSGEGRDAKAAWRGREVTRTGACKARALALLDNPITLEYVCEYFEFLASQKLSCCKVCDEEWPVFDKEWPQSGVITAGELAGV